MAGANIHLSDHPRAPALRRKTMRGRYGQVRPALVHLLARGPGPSRLPPGRERTGRHAPSGPRPIHEQLVLRHHPPEAVGTSGRGSASSPRSCCSATPLSAGSGARRRGWVSLGLVGVGVDGHRCRAGAAAAADGGRGHGLDVRPAGDPLGHVLPQPARPAWACGGRACCSAMRVLALFALVPMLFEPVLSFVTKPKPEQAGAVRDRHVGVDVLPRRAERADADSERVAGLAAATRQAGGALRPAVLHVRHRLARAEEAGGACHASPPTARRRTW